MQFPAIRPIILVVEYDPLELTALADSLHTAGYDVVSARGPETALKAVRTTCFDLAVVNVNLRGRSGEKLREEIQTLDLNRETPYLFLSEKQKPDVILRRYENEGVFHLRTPFDVTVFLDLVDRAMWLPHLVTAHIGSTAVSSKHEETESESYRPSRLQPRGPHYRSDVTLVTSRR